MTDTKSGAAAPAGAGEAVAPSPWEQLRAPFPAEKIGKLPKAAVKLAEWKELPKGKCSICNGWHATTKTIHLDFVGHADVTDRLLSVDPQWNWEPLASDEDGLPLFVTTGANIPVGLWIRLTVAGVTRLGFGSVDAGSFDAEKQLIGDALRNAAMRFGVGLDLWRKEVAGASDDAPPADGSTNGSTATTLPPARTGGTAAAPNRPTKEKTGRNCPECGTGDLEIVTWPGKPPRVECSDYTNCKYRAPVESADREPVASGVDTSTLDDGPPLF